MTKRCSSGTGLLLVVLIVAWLLPAAWAEDLGKMRVQLMSGRWLEGQVERLADGSYVITQGKGISLPVKENEVRKLVPLEEAGLAQPDADDESEDENAFRRRISDAEIDKLLQGLDIDISADSEDSSDTDDTLPLNEDNLKEMLRQAGKGAKYMEKPHMVVVYTSSDDKARKLLARLEAVWRWNMIFTQLLDIPVQLPEHKLEVFYFGTHKEFQTHGVNTSGYMNPMGVLGYYSPSTNRCHFFDMETWPPVAQLLERAKDASIPYKQRKTAENKARRWVEFQNCETMQHEIGHHIHFSIGVFPRDVFNDRDSLDSLPRWLVEGTTMLFEFPPTRAGGSLGATNHGRLDSFRNTWGQRLRTPAEMKAFILDNGVFLRGGGTTYPLGWALVNYLWKKHREGYAEYVRIISEREPGDQVSYTQREKEFEDLFGEVDEDWIKGWYDYLFGLRLKRSVLPPNLGP